MKNLKIKRALAADLKAIWLIRNSPAVRRNSINTKKISFKRHQSWFANKYFKNKNNHCFILKDGQTAMGYCRFDLNKNKFLLSIALDEKYRGRGLADYLLNKSLKLIKAGVKILAEIKPENEPSINIFLRNNFEIYKQDKKLFYLAYNKLPDDFRRSIIKLYYSLMRQPLKKSQAIVWLQGDRYDRAEKTIELYKKGWAPRIVISGNNKLIGKNNRTEENNISLEKMAGWLIAQKVKKQNIIIDVNSLNTKNQAKYIISLAQDRKWPSLILVGSSYYQPRAFLTFLKQVKKLKWRGKIFNAPALVAWNKIPAGRRKFAWQYFYEEIEKIKKYKKDLVAPRAGLKNFK